MRFLAGISCALLFAGALFGQYHFGTPVLTGGFGNLGVFPPGMQSTIPSSQRFTSNAVFPASGGPHLVIPSRRPAGYSGSGAVVVPYAYPVYVGGSGYFDNSYAQAPAPQQQQPNVTVVYPPQPAPVIVNQFGPGAAPQPMAAPPDQEPLSAYQPAYQPSTQSDNQPAAAHYLIALKDHTVYSVVAYWVDGDTLHYFTSGNVHNQASLSLVDRELTSRLNSESGVEVKLPPAK
jgi:hypothetical protein